MLFRHSVGKKRIYSTYMFITYFKIAWRNFSKRKVFSLINLIGLASGMAVCLLLTLYILIESGYDRFHEKGNQIYRLAVKRIYPGRIALLGEIPQSIGQAVKLECPEVLENVRVVQAGKTVKVGGEIFQKETIMGADSNFFKVFSGDFIEGSKSGVLKRPNTAVINESTATRFFGSPQNAMNKHILANGFNDCIIDGVCKDWPAKSHFTFSVLLSNTGFNLNEPNYYDFSTYTYLLLNKNASPASLEAKLPSIVTKYVAPTIQKGFGQSFEQFSKAGNGYTYFLQPLQNIHLYSNLQDELKPTTNIGILYTTAAIGIFILLLACINFINLSTAISVERAREIGIRRTFGSDKKSIVWQFLGESILFSLISLVVSLVLSGLSLPLLNTITGSTFSFVSFFNPASVVAIISFGILTGVMAGLYPAIVLSSFKPIAVLKGRFKTGATGMFLRNGLVVFQFSVSVTLIICTIVIKKQTHLMLGNSAGFTKDNVIAIRQTYALGNNRQAFLQEVSNIQGVDAKSLCSNLPQEPSYVSCAMMSVETNMQRTDRTVYVDDQYQKVLGLQMVAGRFFSNDFPTDSTALVLNQAAAIDFGLTSPVGSRITSTEINFNTPGGNTQTVYTVVGVVKDFHYESMHERIAPLILANANKFGGSTVATKIKGGYLQTVIPVIENTWKKFNPKFSFSYSFLDNIVATQYKAELTAQKIFSIFSMLAILIGCIGLFGLVMYATFQRTKEISVRRVLGATTANIVLLLSGQFFKLVTIAALIAFPVAWLAMHSWLQHFAYRVDIGWGVFVVALLLISIIAFVTISFQAIKAAIANPVKSLRSE
jgi:putative ABC transport system permease protein